MLLKDVAVHDPFQDARWNVSLLWSLVVDLVRLNGSTFLPSFPTPPAREPNSRLPISLRVPPTDESESLALVESYNRFVSLILSLGLDTSAFEPSLLDVRSFLPPLPSFLPSHPLKP